MTRTERPAWVGVVDPMVVNDTQRAALRQLTLSGNPRWVIGGTYMGGCRLIHRSWVHHSTRDALLRRGLIAIDDHGYVTLTDAGRQAVTG